MRLELTHWASASEATRHAVLSRPLLSQDASVRDTAKEIIDTVRADGDAALIAFARQFDGARQGEERLIGEFRVSQQDIADAEEQLSPSAKAAIDAAIANVRRFHEQQLPTTLVVETVPGVRCERISHALDSVGLYVPAGSAPLPSAAIMLAVPARIAKCPQIILCTPPRSDGKADPAVLVAAARAGVDEIYVVGGAQAIAAMAYGTETIPKVRKIMGPGNAWVTAAKSIVSSDPLGAAIDLPAGPSEVLIVADESANAEFVAADLLSQAEHGADSQVLLVTTAKSFALAVQSEVDKQLSTLSRADIAGDALQHSRIILVDDLESAIAISNRYAPEHLLIQTKGYRDLLAKIRNAGSVFLGQWTPESVGDYCSGTNHVLPTYGYAATYSGLGVEQYMRQMTVQELSREGLCQLAPTVVELAGLEGLDAHAAAVTRRVGPQR